jgi:hypothetical protein
MLLLLQIRFISSDKRNFSSLFQIMKTLPLLFQRILNSPERPAQLVIIHVGFGLSFTPAPSNFVGVCELELPVRSFPRNAVCVGRVGQQLQ